MSKKNKNNRQQHVKDAKTLYAAYARFIDDYDEATEYSFIFRIACKNRYFFIYPNEYYQPLIKETTQTGAFVKYLPFYAMALSQATGTHQDEEFSGDFELDHDYSAYALLVAMCGEALDEIADRETDQDMTDDLRIMADQYIAWADQWTHSEC